MEKSNKLIFFGLILGLSFIAGAYLVSRTFLAVKKMDNVISVSGSAKQAVTADNARWNSSFSRTVLKEELSDGYARMKADEKAVSAFLDAQGLAEKYEISAVSMNEVWKNDTNAPKEYNLTQTVTAKSDDVNKLKELAKSSDKLASQGIFFSSYPVEYYYSQLPALRVSLLPAAIKDARDRAEMIAQSSGRSLDAVESVTMGVVQVMAAGGIDVSDYGSYDTSGIDKEVMITVKASFSLK